LVSTFSKSGGDGVKGDARYYVSTLRAAKKELIAMNTIVLILITFFVICLGPFKKDPER